MPRAPTILPCPIQLVLAGEWDRSELLNAFRRGDNGWKGDERLVETYDALTVYREQASRDSAVMWEHIGREGSGISGGTVTEHHLRLAFGGQTE